MEQCYIKTTFGIAKLVSHRIYHTPTTHQFVVPDQHILSAELRTFLTISSLCVHKITSIIGIVWWLTCTISDMLCKKRKKWVLTKKTEQKRNQVPLRVVFSQRHKIILWVISEGQDEVKLTS